MKRTMAVVSAVVMVAALCSAAEAAVLVGQWNFENAANLGLDSSGTNHNGTVSGSVTQVAGPAGFGNAAHFDAATSAKIAVPPMSGYDAKPGATFALWFKLDAIAARFDGLISQGGTAYRILTSFDKLYMNTGGGPDLTPSATGFHQGPAFNVGEWNHLALVIKDQGTSRVAELYINGVLHNTNTQAATNASAGSFSTYIGAGDDGGAHFLAGSLDDVRVYDGALTATEVAGLIPEPMTLGLLAAGGLGLLRRRRR